MSTETILDEAKRVCAERQAAYGPPQKNHDMTAALWSVYLGIPISARDVCLLNGLQKVSRDRCGKPKRDNLTDLAGFADNAHRVSAEHIVAGVDPAAPPGRTVDELDDVIRLEGGHNAIGDSLKDLPEVPHEIVAGLTSPPVPGVSVPLKFPIRFAGEVRWGKSLREMPPTETSAGCLVRTYGGTLCAVLGEPDGFGVVTVRIWEGLNSRLPSYNLHWASPDEVTQVLALVRPAAADEAFPRATSSHVAPEHCVRP